MPYPAEVSTAKMVNYCSITIGYMKMVFSWFMKHTLLLVTQTACSLILSNTFSYIIYIVCKLQLKKAIALLHTQLMYESW